MGFSWAMLVYQRVKVKLLVGPTFVKSHDQFKGAKRIRRSPKLWVWSCHVFNSYIMCQGRSTPSFGDGHPTLNRESGNPYNEYTNPYWEFSWDTLPKTNSLPLKIDHGLFLLVSGRGIPQIKFSDFKPVPEKKSHRDVCSLRMLEEFRINASDSRAENPEGQLSKTLVSKVGIPHLRHRQW